MKADYWMGPNINLNDPPAFHRAGEHIIADKIVDNLPARGYLSAARTPAPSADSQTAGLESEIALRRAPPARAGPASTLSPSAGRLTMTRPVRTQFLCLAALCACVFAAAPGPPSRAMRHAAPAAAPRQKVDPPPVCFAGRGGTIFADKREVTVEILPGNPHAGFTSDLFLSIDGRPPIYFGTSREAGRVTNIGRLPEGVEIVFLMVVRETGDNFYSGRFDRNPDRIPHADVECVEYGKYNVSFEDLLGGGDRSYNDLRFQVRTEPACDPDSDAPPETEQIGFEGAECGPNTVGPVKTTWGQFGERAVLEADTGHRMELRCISGNMPDSMPTFQLRFAKPGGQFWMIGVCPYGGGCNSGTFTHSGDKDKNGKPDCFVQTRWESRDYHTNDTFNWFTGQKETATVLDHAVSTYDAVHDNLVKENKMFQYADPAASTGIVRCNDPKVAEGKYLGTIRVDPPLGPATESFFEAVLRRMLRTGRADPPMTADPFSPADLNRDGKLDAADRAIFDAAFGSCAGRANYNPLAEFNADGCVTPSDERVFLSLFRAGSRGNAPPVARCGAPTLAAPPDSCAATLNPRDLDAGSTDPDGDALTFSLGSPAALGVGAHKATLVVTDARGASSSCAAAVTVADRIAPAISQPAASRTTLSPPNHRMVEVVINYTATDNCGAPTTSLSVTSNEPVDEPGSGKTSPDWEVVDARRVRLRAERAGTGAGRVYTVTVTAADGAGNTSRRSVEVLVPHN